MHKTVKLAIGISASVVVITGVVLLVLLNAVGFRSRNCDKSSGELTNPFSGGWTIHRSNRYIPIHDGNQVFSFIPGENDGYQWYSSTVTAAYGEPVIQIGIRDTVEDSQRIVRAKFKGVNYGSRFWSMNGDDRGSFAAPVSIVIAESPANPDCLVIDSIDLGAACGVVNRCISTLEGDIERNLGTMILQRVELCGADRMIGQGDRTKFGSLGPCPGVENGP